MHNRQHNGASSAESTLSVSSLLSSIAAPIVLFYETGEIQQANPAFHELLATRDWLWIADRRLKSKGQAIAAFDQNVCQLAQGREHCVTMVIEGIEKRYPLLVGFGIVPGSRVVMCNFVDPFQTHSPRASALKSLFGLTENESQVTAMIAVGLDYKEIAADRRVSIETIRSYTKSIFKKLGVSSRASVVSTVQSATMPLGLLFAAPCGK